MRHVPGHLANMLAFGIVLAYKEGICPIPLSWDIPNEYIVGVPTNVWIRFVEGEKIEFSLMVTDQNCWRVASNIIIHSADDKAMVVISRVEAQTILNPPQTASGGPTP